MHFHIPRGIQGHLDSRVYSVWHCSCEHEKHQNNWLTIGTVNSFCYYWMHGNWKTSILFLLPYNYFNLWISCLSQSFISPDMQVIQVLWGLRVSLRFTHSFLCLWNKDLCLYQRLDRVLQSPRTTWWVTWLISRIRATTPDVWPVLFFPRGVLEIRFMLPPCTTGRTTIFYVCLKLVKTHHFERGIRTISCHAIHFLEVQLRIFSRE